MNIVTINGNNFQKCQYPILTLDQLICDFDIHTHLLWRLAGTLPPEIPLVWVQQSLQRTWVPRQSIHLREPYKIKFWMETAAEGMFRALWDIVRFSSLKTCVLEHENNDIHNYCSVKCFTKSVFENAHNIVPYRNPV